MDFKDYTINELRHLLADNDIDFARTDDKADLIRLAEEAFGSNRIKNTDYIEKATARLKKEGKYTEPTVSSSNSSSSYSSSNGNKPSGSGFKWLWPVAGVAVVGLAAWALIAHNGNNANEVVKDSEGKILTVASNVSGSLRNLLGDAGAAIAGIASNATNIDEAKNNANQLLSAVNNLPDNIKNDDDVKNAIDKLDDAVKSDNLDDINSAIVELQGAVADAAKSAQTSAANAIADIKTDADNFDDAKKNADEAIKQFDKLPEGIRNNQVVANAKAQLDAAVASGDASQVNDALKAFKDAVKDATSKEQQAITLIAGIPDNAGTTEEAQSNAKFALDEYKNLSDDVKDDDEVEKTQKALNDVKNSDDVNEINQAIADFKAAVANAANNTGDKTEGVIAQDGRQDGVYPDGPFQGGADYNLNAVNFVGQHVTILDRASGYQGRTYAQVRTDAGQTFWIDEAAVQ